jgi:hypothetical protein
MEENNFDSSLPKKEINISNNSISNYNINNFKEINNKSIYSNQYNYIKRKSPNDFIFLCDELHIYREIPGIGNFSSYKNGSVKGIFNDKTICLMNKDQFYAKIINKYGEKDILYIPELPANSPYYVYIKHLFDFYDACFNKEMIYNKEKQKIELEKQIDERINKIDLFNNLIFNKNKEENYSKQYYVDKIPTALDIQNLLNRNQKAIDNIHQIKYSNAK